MQAELKQNSKQAKANLLNSVEVDFVPDSVVMEQKIKGPRGKVNRTKLANLLFIEEA